MSQQARNTAVITWLEGATGFAWVWAGQDEARQSYPYGTVDIVSELGVGQEHKERVVDPALPPGADTRLTITEERAVTMQLVVQAKHDPANPTGFHDARAMAYVDVIRKSVRRPSVRAQLRAAGLVPIQVMMAAYVPDNVNGEFVSRATVDVRFRHHAVDTPDSEIGSHIEKVRLSSDFGNADDSLDLTDEELPS